MSFLSTVRSFATNFVSPQGPVEHPPGNGPTAPTTGPLNPAPAPDGVDFSSSKPLMLALAREGVDIKCPKGTTPVVRGDGGTGVVVVCETPPKKGGDKAPPKTEQPKKPIEVPILE